MSYEWRKYHRDSGACRGNYFDGPACHHPSDHNKPYVFADQAGTEPDWTAESRGDDLLADFKDLFMEKLLVRACGKQPRALNRVVYHPRAAESVCQNTGANGISVCRVADGDGGEFYSATSVHVPGDVCYCKDD